jgi:hypothetical protein
VQKIFFLSQFNGFIKSGSLGLLLILFLRIELHWFFVSVLNIKIHMWGEIRSRPYDFFLHYSRDFAKKNSLRVFERKLSFDETLMRTILKLLFHSSVNWRKWQRWTLIKYFALPDKIPLIYWETFGGGKRGHTLRINLSSEKKALEWKLIKTFSHFHGMVCMFMDIFMSSFLFFFFLYQNSSYFET